MSEYGSGGDYSVSMAGPFGTVAPPATKVTTINAPVDDWKGAISPYSQVVDVEGVSVNSKIDIQMTEEQISAIAHQSIAFTTANEDGIVTLYAFGDKPGADCVFQATVTEVTTV